MNSLNDRRSTDPYRRRLVSVTSWAVIIAGAWLWAHRAMWRGPWRGSAAAVGLLSLAFMPFHLITTGVVALVVLGCATTKEETRC